MTPTPLLHGIVHTHSWHLAEVEYADTGSVRRLECGCGEIDYQPDS